MLVPMIVVFLLWRYFPMYELLGSFKLTEDAKAVARLVEERFPKLNGPVEIYSVGTTIGSHTGPGTVALFFVGDKRWN